jgi:tagatose 6-phosphate kinase
MIICLGTTPTVQRTMTFANLTLDAVNRATHVREYASGKSVGVARVLKTLGQPCVALGFVGGDSGKFLVADLDRAGIAHDFVTVQPPTRLCITVVDKAAGMATELVEESRQLEPRDYESLLARLAKHLASADTMVLSGTLPPGAPGDFYARCVEAAGARVRVILDAVGQPLLEALPHRPFVVKPNQSEVGRTLGVEVDSEPGLRRAMQELVSRGARWVLVTRGREGVLVTDGNSFWRIVSPRVEAISPIGSGDSFAAGLAAGLARGQGMPQACILATACGAANAKTLYAAHVETRDVEALTALVEMRAD